MRLLCCLLVAATVQATAVFAKPADIVEPSLRIAPGGAAAPRVALTWIANELSGMGVTLKAGEVVTTGTCMVPIDVLPGDSVTADYGALGTISARFTA